MKIDYTLISSASYALQKEIVKDGIYNGAYAGYISSFGSAIISMGLLPAVLLFENEDTNTQQKRHYLIDAIRDVMNAARKAKGISTIGKEESLSCYIMKDHTQARDLLKEITAAGIAIKLALRLYKKETL